MMTLTPLSIFTGLLLETKRVDVGWFCVEVEHLPSHQLLFAVSFHVFVYDVLCMRCNFAHLGDIYKV